MKKLLMPVMALLLIIQSSYLLAGDVNEHSAILDTALSTAILHNKLEDVQKLLNRGAKLNIQAHVLPLMLASTKYFNFGNNMPTIELLLQNGADPHFENINHISTLNYVNDELSHHPAYQAVHSARKQELIDLFKQIPPGGINIKGSEDEVLSAYHE